MSAEPPRSQFVDLDRTLQTECNHFGYDRAVHGSRCPHCNKKMLWVRPPIQLQ